MAMRQLTFDEVSANKIRSYTNTLRNYTETSLRAHGRMHENVHKHALTLKMLVDHEFDAAPDSRLVARRRDQFYRLCEQYNLLE